MPKKTKAKPHDYTNGAIVYLQIQALTLGEYKKKNLTRPITEYQGDRDMRMPSSLARSTITGAT